jgi:uncharacterized membrane protein YqaE (UPF0057 family)
MTEQYLAIKDFRCVTHLIDLNKIPSSQLYNTLIQTICEYDTDMAKYYSGCIYLSYNGKPITRATLTKELFTDKINHIEWFTRVKGGFIKDVINFVVSLARMFLFIPKFLIWLGGLVVWIIRTTFFIGVVAIRYITNDGIIGLVKFLVLEIIMAPITLVITGLRTFFNWVGRNSVQALWGADNVPEPGEPSDKVLTSCSAGQKCYKTAEGTIPFSVIIATILCPPVGVFMEYGLTGWFNVLITALLTLVFYFPGLIYALILLYC